MRLGSSRGAAAVVLVVAVSFVAGGCGQGDDKKSPAEDKPKHGEQHTGGDKGTGQKVHDHSDWWCAEHGIPEHLCSMCNEKVAAECKKKGDWCEKHDRAKSQCFKCDPALREKFAARYRAKYGKEPPPIEEEAEGQPKKESKD